MNSLVKQNALVIGGESFIGSSLVNHLSKLNTRVLKTTRHKENINDTTLYLNLEEHIEEFKVPEYIDTAYICAAEANIERCEKDSLRAYAINTLAPLKIAKILLNQKIFIVFLSTSAVFDGKSPKKKVEDPTNPMTFYGLQKLGAELGLKRMGEDILIVRPTKVFSLKSPLLKNWIEKLKSGAFITPFSDLTVSPIHIDYLTNSLILLGERKEGRVVHISGEKDITYENLAYLFAEAFSFSKTLVRPMCSKNSEAFIPHRPLYTSLDTSEIESKLKLKAQKIDHFIENILCEFNRTEENLKNGTSLGN